MWSALPGLPEPRPLPAATAHVWTVSLDGPGALELTLLDAGERARAKRFRRDLDCARYVAAHIALRQILAGYLAVAPADLVFTAGPGGKPECAQAPWLRFNLTHAGSCTLLAMARGREVGVDLEEIAPGTPDPVLIERVCTTVERAWLATLPVAEQTYGFLRLWTAKEAYLKALGVGLQVEPQTIDLVFAGDQIGLPLTPEESARPWRLHAIEAPNRMVAALVVEGTVAIQQFEYAFDTVRRE